MAKKRLIVNNLIFVADQHCGCRLGLCPPKATKLDDGGTYRPSPFQRKLWRLWREFWDEWVPKVCRGDPYAVCQLGDAVDGVHHGSVTQVSHNLVDQKRIAKKCLEPVVAACEGRFYMVRGTEAHVGPSAQLEEELAESLGAIPDAEGRYARYELWKLLGPGRPKDCALVHAMHHIGTTGSSHYESTAVHKELVEAFQESGRWGNRAPDFVVRAHRHRYLHTEIATEGGRAVSIVLPGWQGKTPFTYRIPGARQSMPQFGGIMVRCGDEERYMRQRVWSLQRPRAE